MSVLTGKALSRRTVLRGVGATLALPLLDSMVPAFARIHAAGTPALRFGAVYVPNGMIMPNFTPATVGTGFEFTPILAPLLPLRDRVQVLSGLCNEQAKPRKGEGAGTHSRASGAFLTGAHPKQTEGSDMQAGISVDQIVAREFGKHTQLPSLELALDSNDFIGGCDRGYACTYNRTISWRSDNTPLPMENEPRAIFERLFGDVGSTDPAARLARRIGNRSILDSVLEEATGLHSVVGAGDRRRLAEYLEAIRDVERRIQIEDAQSDRELSLVEQPLGGVPATFGEHTKMLFDLTALAFQCDFTRVFTLMTGREGTRRSYEEIGVGDAHHPLTHSYSPEPVAKVTKINTYHMERFAYFLQKLQSLPDGDGSLLDHSIFVYGAGIGDGNAHTHENVPVVLVGGAGSHLKGGRHVHYSGNPPVANLWLTVLDKLGLDAERFGDSPGQLEGLSEI